MTPRDGLPRFSARSACCGDAGHRKAWATTSESLGRPPFGSRRRPVGGRRNALTMHRIAGGLSPTRRTAYAISKPTFPICHPNSWNSYHFPTAKGTVSPYAAIRWHDFGNRPALGRPLGHFSRHPDTPLLSLSPRRRFPRPTPERVFVADHQSSSGFSGTGPSAPPPQPIGT